MYSRDFGGVQSDGIYSGAFEDVSEHQQPSSEPAFSAAPAAGHGKNGLIDFSFLKRLETDDLLIIAIGILLLLDSDMSSDMILLFVAAMLFL